MARTTSQSLFKTIIWRVSVINQQLILVVSTQGKHTQVRGTSLNHVAIRRPDVVDTTQLINSVTDDDG